MKSRLIPMLIALAILLVLSIPMSAAQGPSLQGDPPSTQGIQGTVGSAFTYQGRLNRDGEPVNGTCDMTFSLYDDASGGNLIGTVNAAVDISDGLFTVALDFPGAFQGEARFLEIAVACPGDPGFVTLTPRQSLTAAPYALSLRPGAEIVGPIDGGPILLAHNTAAAPLSGGMIGTSDSTYGYGVIGLALAASGETSGVYGRSDSTEGSGVYGLADASSGSTYGVYGRSDSSEGTGVYGLGRYGVLGRTDSADGYGVVGWASAAGGPTIGVYGESDSTDGWGVYGLADASSGTNYGVYGRSESPTGYGVYGESSYVGVYGQTDAAGGDGVFGYSMATSGETCGVYGRTNSTGGYGVFGRAAAATGYTYGVYGRSDSTNGRGVRGVATADSGYVIGVEGESVSPNGYGVSGLASATSGAAVGVAARSLSTEGYGVWAWASAASGNTYGVYGRASSPDGVGVYGLGMAGSGYNRGVVGVSNSPDGAGVVGTANAGGCTYGDGGCFGVLGASNAGNGVYGDTQSGVAVYAQSWATGVALRAQGQDQLYNLIEAWHGPLFLDREFYVSGVGEVYADGSFHAGGADFAEMLPAAAGLQPGDVLVIGPDGRLARSTQAYQPTVVGVYSTQPGFVGGAADDADLSGQVPLAVVGIVPVRVTAENGPIRPGDLLVASSTPGHAMRAGANPPVGTVIGKALGSLERGSGVIQMLVMLQ